MSAEKPNFLSQPVVKNVFMFRNGDPYYEARRIVINQRRVCNFETLLREVTGGIQAPFGAVRNIYTPRGGHKVDCLEGLRSGEQYVAAGRERFRKLDYLQIGSRRKRMMQMLPMQAKPPPQNRITASPRFLKPIKEPCLIFVVANGDIINPAVRLLIHQRMLEQFDKILEMITEKMGLRVLGGVRSLYTFEGNQVTDGKQLGSGHHYVAVGREKFKKLPYSDLLLTKRRGTRRVNGISAYSLPPIYRFPKQNGNSKSVFQASDGGGDSKTFPPAHRHNSKEHLSSIVREISQARLISLRKKRSGQSMSLGVTDNDDLESKPVDGNSENQTPEDQPAEEKPAADDPKTPEENGEEAEEKEKQEKQEEEEAAETTNEDCCSGGGEEEEKQEASSKGEEDKKENAQPNGETEGEKEQGAGDAKEDEAEEDIKNEMVDESKQEVKKEEQSSIDTNSGNAKDRKEGRNESRPPSKIETEQEDKHGQAETKDQDSGESESGSKDAANDGDAGEEENENNDRGKAHADNESKESHSSRSSSSNSNQEGDVTKANRSATKESGGGEERKENGETSGEDDEVESESEQKTERKKASSRNDAAETTAQGENRNKNEDESRKETD